jgi:short-subunit dehydrogenase
VREPRSILITGASSGLGEALALDYARPGTLLALTGRDRDRLDAVADACRPAGADVLAETVDAVDEGAMRAFIEAAHAEHPLDLVIANAGISAGTGRGGETQAQAQRVMAVNVDGVVNTITPAVALMRDKPGAGDAPRGQVAIMSSLAAFRGFPGAPAYCASKAAVRIWGEALRGELHAAGIEVSVICPGYVRTRMTANNRFRMPFLMDSDRAAGIIRRGLARNRGRIVFPVRLYLLVKLLLALPMPLTDRMLRQMPKKD